MPWHMGKSAECPSSKPWAVIKDADGKVVGCHATKDDAKKQMAALYVNVPDANRAGLPVELRSAVVSAVDFAERVIELIAVPYDSEAVVEYRGQLLTETVAPGAFDGIETRNDHVTVNRDHDYGRTIGKTMAYQTGDPRGLVARLRISNTQLGDESLRLAADDVLRASVGMAVRRSDQVISDGKRRIKRAFLDHIALVPNPAYKGADILAVRQEHPVMDTGPLPSTPNLDAVLRLLSK
jgi:HK97 family phage prohead protease